MNIQDLSQEVAQDYAGPNAAFDPALILTIAEIVIALIQKFKDCRQKPDEAAEISQNPGRFQRILLNSVVRKEIGRREFRRDGDKIVKNLLKCGAKLDAEKMQALYDDEEGAE